MSAGTSGSTRHDRSEAYVGYDDSHYEHGEGWVTFAGVMLSLLGIINIVGGIAAIDDANFWVSGAKFVFADLNTWGWILLITGVVQVLAAFGIFAKNQLARWLGVGFAGLNALAQLFFIAAFPLWAITLFAIDVLVIYGLIVYGGRERAV